MSKFKFELNYKGVGSLLHSKEMDEVLKEHGNRIAQKAGAGYDIKRMPTRNIAVYTSTDEARNDNLKNNTLLKAIGG